MRRRGAGLARNGRNKGPGTLNAWSPDKIPGPVERIIDVPKDILDDSCDAVRTELRPGVSLERGQQLGGEHQKAKHLHRLSGGIRTSLDSLPLRRQHDPIVL